MAIRNNQDPRPCKWSWTWTAGMTVMSFQLYLFYSYSTHFYYKGILLMMIGYILLIYRWLSEIFYLFLLLFNIHIIGFICIVWLEKWSGCLELQENCTSKQNLGFFMTKKHKRTKISSFLQTFYCFLRKEIRKNIGTPI